MRDCHSHDAIGVARVLLFHLAAALAESAHLDRGQVVRVAQCRVERKLDIVPQGEVAGGLAVGADSSRLRVAKVADIMHWPVAAHHSQWRRGVVRQLQAALEEEIEGDIAAVVGLAPDSEVPREAVAEHIAGIGVGGDGEAYRGGRAHIGGAPYGSPESLLEHTRDRREFGTAAGDV
jgi:hypothetical protein